QYILVTCNCPQTTSRFWSRVVYLSTQTSTRRRVVLVSRRSFPRHACRRLQRSTLVSIPDRNYFNQQMSSKTNKSSHQSLSRRLNKLPPQFNKEDGDNIINSRKSVC